MAETIEVYEVLGDGDPIIIMPTPIDVFDTETGEMVEVSELEGGSVFLSCCDCGLVHRMEVIRHKISGEIGIRFIRDDERTGERRRETESQGT